MPMASIAGVVIVAGPDDQMVPAADELVATWTSVDLGRVRPSHGAYLVLATVPLVPVAFQGVGWRAFLGRPDDAAVVPRHLLSVGGLVLVGWFGDQGRIDGGWVFAFVFSLPFATSLFGLCGLRFRYPQSP
jgi:hypothetical protein